VSIPVQNAPAISVVVPILNEAGNISWLIDALVQVFRGQNISWEGVLVDDGSDDASWRELQSLANEHCNLSIIRFTRNFGKEAAIYAGLVHARAAVTLVMDSDLQHPPELIGEMLAAWQDGQVDVVSAVKAKRQQESMIRGLGARLFYWLFRKSARMDLESSTDFKLISARVREAYLCLPEKHRFFRGLTSWFGFPEKTVTFDPPQRSSATPSRWSTGGLYRYALSSLVSFSSLPIRMLGWLGAATLVFALVLGAQTLFMKLSGQAVEGFTTVILVLLFVGSLLIIGLAIVGTYVAEIYQQVRERPVFVICEAQLSQEYTQSVRQSDGAAPGTDQNSGASGSISAAAQ
jgi:glycosyltransferase involved in cell wall biosynthesis